MHLAARNGHPETALVLLKRGVALMMPNKVYNILKLTNTGTSISFSMKFNNIQSGYLGLHMAAMSGHTSVVRTLLQKGTNVDIETKVSHFRFH